MLESLECLTAVSERSRRKLEMGVMAELQHGSDWMTAHRLVMEALQLPESYYVPAELPEEEAAKLNKTKKEKKIKAVDEDGTDKTDAAAAADNDNDSSDDETGADAADKVPLPPNPGATIKRSPFLPEIARKQLERSNVPYLPQALTDHLVGFDNFLVWLGRVGLNQEDDGGVYLLHPCLNHSCDANAIVKRTPSLNNSGAREAKPSRIYLVAQKDIAAGEELTISYVSPSAPTDIRRAVLQNHYLFSCTCERCERELEAAAAAAA